MSGYTLEEYAKDLQAVTLSELFGKLNVARTEVNNPLVAEATREACKLHIPILEAEVFRRGEKIPHWMYPSSILKS